MLSLLSPTFWLAAILGLGGAFSAGAYAHMRWTEAKPVKAALAASEQARGIEHDKSSNAIRKLDNYIAVQQGNAFAAVRTNTLVVSLQHDIASIAAAPASGAASGCEPDGRFPRVAELLSESLGLLGEGKNHIEELQAKRDALIK